MKSSLIDLSSTTTLNNQVEMPWLGLGVFRAEPGEEVRQAVAEALRVGYRHIDTASFYENEADVGTAVRESDIPPEEVFVTSKLWNDDQGYDNTLRAFERSMEAIGLDKLDLYLVHWPIKDSLRETWRAMERIYEEGRVRAIGVSNFLVHHLQELNKEANVVPAVNQVEFHPFLTLPELQDYCRRNEIQLEAWSPLTRGKHFDNPIIRSIAEQHGKTPAQVLIRWDLQHGVVTIPKSVHAERIRENADVFDFHLTPGQMDRLDGLNQEERLGPHPDEMGGWR